MCWGGKVDGIPILTTLWQFTRAPTSDFVQKRWCYRVFPPLLLGFSWIAKKLVWKRTLQKGLFKCQKWSNFNFFGLFIKIYIQNNQESTKNCHIFHFGRIFGEVKKMIIFLNQNFWDLQWHLNIEMKIFLPLSALSFIMKLVIQSLKYVD